MYLRETRSWRRRWFTFAWMRKRSMRRQTGEISCVSRTMGTPIYIYRTNHVLPDPGRVSVSGWSHDEHSRTDDSRQPRLARLTFQWAATQQLLPEWIGSRSMESRGRPSSGFCAVAAKSRRRGLLSWHEAAD